MPQQLLIINISLLIPLAVAVAYYDVRYRRIPNELVLVTLISGLFINFSLNRLDGFLTSAGGFALALGLMLVPHIFGAMGAGDVKLFASIGAVLGVKLVLPAFVIVVMLGGILAVYTMVRSKTMRRTMQEVFRILGSIVFQTDMRSPRSTERRQHSIPYGVAITVGSLITLAAYRP
jgi:prepilin peptidase CpaA